MTAELILDICTPERKTWVARITGPDSTYGVHREWVHATQRNTSRSGRTGSAAWTLAPGIYERREGRRRLAGNNGSFQVTGDGVIVPLASAAAVLDALAAAAKPAAKQER